MQHAPLVSELQHAQRNRRLNDLQAVLDSPCMHCCVHARTGEGTAAAASGGGPLGCGMTVSSERSVTYFGLEHCGPLLLKTWRCSSCGKLYEPEPQLVGCFGSTPTVPSMWFDGRVMELYRRMGPIYGLSATGKSRNPQIQG